MKLKVNVSPDDLGFAYLDENGHYCPVLLNNGGAVEFASQHTTNDTNIRIIGTQGRTPSTYYSGNRKISQLTFESNLLLKLVEFEGHSNAAAEQAAKASGAQFVFVPRNACCQAIVVLEEMETDSEWGVVKGTKKVKGGVVFCYGPAKVCVSDYLENLVPSGNIWGVSYSDIMFSGWKRSNNLVEGDEATHHLEYIKEIWGMPCFIPFASRNGNENGWKAAVQAVEEHLLRMGYSDPNVEDEEEIVEEPPTSDQLLEMVEVEEEEFPDETEF